jgi:hypothetical protein
MAIRRKLDQSRDDLCVGALHKRAWKSAGSFFDSDRSAVLNVRSWLVIGFMEKHIVELPPINHFSTPAALVEVPFLGFA